MAVHVVMDHTGDTRHEFDPADAAAIAVAGKRFQELTGAGFTPFTRAGHGTTSGRKVEAFDPADQEVLFVPRMQGG
jgi:hypothetical protein